MFALMIVQIGKLLFLLLPEFQEQITRLESLSCSLATTFIDALFIHLRDKCAEALSAINQRHNDERDRLETARVSMQRHISYMQVGF